MSRGKKYNTPKRFWKKMSRKPRPWYARQSWRKFSPHVIGRKHNKFKWHYRQKKWYNEQNVSHMSMRFPTSHELWFWD